MPSGTGVAAHVLVMRSMLLCITDQHGAERECMIECFQLCREASDPRVEADGLKTMAGLSLKTGQPDRGARLRGAAQALRERIGNTSPPVAAAKNQELFADLRSALGDEGLERELAAGRAMSLDNAIQVAITQ